MRNFIFLGLTLTLTQVTGAKKHIIKSNSLFLIYFFSTYLIFSNLNLIPLNSNLKNYNYVHTTLTGLVLLQSVSQISTAIQCTWAVGNWDGGCIIVYTIFIFFLKGQPDSEQQLKVKETNIIKLWYMIFNLRNIFITFFYFSREHRVFPVDLFPLFEDFLFVDIKIVENFGK